MTSVTNRIKNISQPRGGVYPLRDLIDTSFTDERELPTGTSLSGNLLGTAVDGFVRILLGANVDEAFSHMTKVSLRYGIDPDDLGEVIDAVFTIKDINDIPERAIQAVISLADIHSYAFVFFPEYKPSVWRVSGNSADLDFVRVCVLRTVEWLRNRKIVRNGFVFPGAYTPLITSGDGDLLMEDGLWDYKVSKSKPSSQNILQLLVYWRMGLHSDSASDFEVPSLGIFNPYLHKEWRIDVSSISDSVISFVDSEVIGYGDFAHQEDLCLQILKKRIISHRSRSIHRWAVSKGLVSSNFRGRLPAHIVEKHDADLFISAEEEMRLFANSVSVELFEGVRFIVNTDNAVWPSWVGPGHCGRPDSF